MKFLPRSVVLDKGENLVSIFIFAVRVHANIIAPLHG
jgi:hypothetical protein